MPAAVAPPSPPAVLSAAPAATPAVSDALMATLTLTESASAVVRLSAISPSFCSISLPAPPSRPFAVDVAVPLVSARAAPAERPTLDPDRATEMPAACAEAPTSSTLILPLRPLARVSSPVPPSAPVAFANALPLASARPAAMVRPFWAAAASTETVTATAKGLDGGAGDDRLYNEGGVTLQRVKADAGAVSVSVDAAAAQNGLTIAAGLADASGKAFANATGADGGTGDDTLVNSSKGKISVEDVGASAHAAGISVALSGSSVGLSAGAALADTSGTATSTAKGLDGGAGNDMLPHHGG